MNVAYNRSSKLFYSTLCLIVAVIALSHIGWAPISDLDTSEFKGLSAEGDKAYSPTRLEWISLLANATLSKNVWKTEGFAIYFASAGQGTDTMAIIGIYNPDRVAKDTLAKEVEFARQSLTALAKTKGWDSWLVIRESIRPKK